MANTYDINIAEFRDKFCKEYQFLYNNRDNVAGYSEAVAAGDEFIRNHPDFIGEFARYRGDFLTSDREVAAFMFTLESYIA